MKTFKDFISDIKTKKAGLEQPDDSCCDRNKPLFGKDIDPHKIPLDVHDEFKPKKANLVLKAKEGKYQITKSDT